MLRNVKAMSFVALVGVLVLGSPGMAQDMTGGARMDPWVPLDDGLATLTGTYTNLGPGAAADANVDSWFSIQPATWTDDGFNAMVASARFTDSNGNQAFPHVDGNLCSHWVFELGQPSDDGSLPMFPLPAGESGAWSVDLPVIPMEGITAGRLVVTEPESLRNSYEVNMPQWTSFPELWHHAGAYNLVSTGDRCDEVDACGDLSACMGTRLWAVEPFEADIEIAQGDSGDPVEGCGSGLTGFTAGNIAVMRRGTCTFFEKLLNAQSAGATGAIIVNHGNCADDPAGDPEECVITMGADPGLGYLIDIPGVMMGRRQGEAIISVLQGNETVRAAIGAIPAESIGMYSWTFESTDPDITNDLDLTYVPLSSFADGFESGDSSQWSATGP